MGTPELEPLGRYPRAVISLLFRRNGLHGLAPNLRGIRLRRLRYRTPSPDGEPLDVSALLALPTGRGGVRGLVSWQHGTASLRSMAPSSKDPVNGLLPAAAFAGHGYALVAPDYVGFGVSDEHHPYYLADHIAGTVRDGIVAALEALSALGVPVSTLLLGGFSEGAHASLAAHRLLEREPVPGLTVLGTAAVAAAVDLPGAVGGALVGGSRFGSLYLAWVAKTYASQYGGRLTDIVRPEWAPVVETYFDGTHDGDSTVAALPDDPRDLVTAEFLAVRAGGGPHWFVDRLAENSVGNWRPAAPVVGYYGMADADVTPEQADRFAEAFVREGSVNEVVRLPGADHEAALLQAAPLLRDWFDHRTGSVGPTPTGP
jgi:hypothetical protein